MWYFSKNKKGWTCPDSSLIAIARIQAADRKDGMKEKIYNGDVAKEYLESLGFEVKYIAEEPLKEIPKYYEARWNNHQHRELYEEIANKSFNGIPLTEAEREFEIAMYHAEEAAAGLL